MWVDNGLKIEAVDRSHFKLFENDHHKGDKWLSNELKDWKYEDNICWVSDLPRVKAFPSLVSCYTTSRQACCNYVQDE